MASLMALAMLLIMGGCVAALMLKGTIVLGFATLVNVLLSSFAAFGYFEWLSRFLLTYVPNIGIWAQLTCFLLLFVLVFAVLQAIAVTLCKHKIDFGDIPEKIGTAVLGVILGYIVTGVLLTAAAMAPLPQKYPYPRFDTMNPNAERPTKVTLNPEGFVTGLFGTVSGGSLSGIVNKNSFATFHPSFVDQLYLNRHVSHADAPLMTDKEAISVPPKAGVWDAPVNLTNTKNEAVSPATGCDLLIVRVQFKKQVIRDGGRFAPSQLRLIAAERDAKHPLGGRGRNIYPIGYMVGKDRVMLRRLDEKIEVPGDYGKPIDFVFNVPTNLVPVLAQFKLNNVVELSAPVTGEDAPAVEPFPITQRSERQRDSDSNAQPRRSQQNPQPNQGRDRTLMESTRGLATEPLDQLQ